MNTRMLVEQMLPLDVWADIRKEISAETLDDEGALVQWLLSPAGISFPSVYRYVSYLKSMSEMCRAIAEMYSLRSPLGSVGTKQHLRHLGTLEPLFMANHLYLLCASGVSGDVLECGTFHGFSACCLSHACARLGRTLHVADSFEGLPPATPGQERYRQGDYAASLESVRENMAALGVPAAVKYIKGWYADSLKTFRDPLCLMWVDVDLYESARDVMENVFGRLDRRGIIFCHEFTHFNRRPPEENERVPPKAVFEAFRRAQLSARSAVLADYFGAIGFEESARWDGLRLLPFLADALDRMDDRHRRYDELNNCRTVRVAFGVKKWFRPFRRFGRP